ncbi:MAG: DUF115 domain-containing protein [Bacillota bacterium]|nr:DUF115 domain-containing protein [Bacillota bacterium]
MQKLRKVNPSLADKLEAVKIDENRLQIIGTQLQGYYTCRASLNDESYGILIHSMVDPLEEARIQVSALKGLEKNSFTVVFGFGFGYHIREIIKQKLNIGLVVIIEPRLDILKAAMETMDLSDIITNDSVKIIAFDESFKDISYNYFTSFNRYINNPIYFQLQSYTNIIAKGGWEPVRKTVSDMIRYSCLALGDSPGDTLVGVANAFNNLEYLVNSADLSNMKDILKGVPAIIVSAGPALDKNFLQLKDVKGKALILVADIIQEKLLKNGIVPDIVSVLERAGAYGPYFKDKILNPEVVLFGQSVIEDQIFCEYPGNYIVCNKGGPIFDLWLAKALDDFNLITPSQSVANLNFCIARHLGCDPIVLIGQNLSYSEDGRSHTRETVEENTTIEKHLNEGIFLDNDSGLIKVKGNYKEFVYTNKYWYQFLKGFEKDIINTKAKVINATEDGAFIEGTSIMSLNEVIDKYCTGEHSVDKFKEAAKKVDEETRIYRIEKLSTAFTTKLAELKQLKLHIEKGMHNCKILLQNRNLKLSDINGLIAKIDKNKQSFGQIDEVFAFIVQAPVIVSLKDDIENIKVDTYEQLLEWVEKQLEFFNDMQGILEMTYTLFEYGYTKVEALKNGKQISKAEIQSIISRKGDDGDGRKL